MDIRAGPSHPAVLNTLLAALPRQSLDHVLAGLQTVELTFGSMLHEQGELIRHVYFPGQALVSLLTIAEGHPAVEVGLIGREGLVGIDVLLGGAVSSLAALVQGDGSAMRMTAAQFRQELLVNPPLQRLLLRFTGALMVQTSQTAACNRFHVVEQRLARWLLMSSDRLELTEFRMTHEFLAHMLGVRRVGVTQAAQVLQGRHLIAYHRGVITITDRPGLEAASCRCYRMVHTRYQQARFTSRL